MYLSSILIDVGDNPDRPRPGRTWLRNLYHVHQRLCMAFPSDRRLADDPHFLKPFKPEDFLCEKQVHVSRQADSNFLFRLDPLPRPDRAMILVQSAVCPDWDYAFHNASFLAACDVKPYDPRFKEGLLLRFRLMANPTKRLRAGSLEADGKPIENKWISKRVPVRNDQLLDWLIRRAEPAGFSIQEEFATIQPGYVYWKKPQEKEGRRLRSVCYDGLLQVTDPVALRKTVIHGIGSSKAFGFGLLSLAPW